jgi:hypothetical protein
MPRLLLEYASGRKTFVSRFVYFITLFGQINHLWKKGARCLHWGLIPLGQDL